MIVADMRKDLSSPEMQTPSADLAKASSEQPAPPAIPRFYMRALNFIFLFPFLLVAVVFSLSFLPFDWCRLPGLSLWRDFVYSYWPSARVIYTGMYHDFGLPRACNYLFYSLLLIVCTLSSITFIFIYNLNNPHVGKKNSVTKTLLLMFVSMLFFIVSAYFAFYEVAYKGRTIKIGNTNCIQCPIPTSALGGFLNYFRLMVFFFMIMLTGTSILLASAHLLRRFFTWKAGLHKNDRGAP